jgi:hypothetical protein
LGITWRLSAEASIKQQLAEKVVVAWFFFLGSERMGSY